MRHLHYLFVFGIIMLLVAQFSVPAVQAQATPDTAFNMNLIITDDQMTDYLSMSAARIQEFLSTQTGILGKYVHTDGRSAAQVIADAATEAKINPKFILTHIQKESSMLTWSCFSDDTGCTNKRSKPKQWYLDRILFFGWCDSCTDVPAKYLGFDVQIRTAANKFRAYITEMSVSGNYYGWGPGISRTIQCWLSDYDGGRYLCTPGTNIVLTPANAATAALYAYTPHPGGNYSFWKIWRDYNFDLHRIYPDGSLLQAKNTKDIYLIQNGSKRRFATNAAFLSRYSYNRIIKVAADTLALYDTGRQISFANYSLLSSPSRGVYLLVDDVKRPIKTRQAFQAAGFSKEEVVKATWDDLNQYPDGEAITTDNLFPSGALMQNKKTGAIFYVLEGIRHPVVSGAIYQSQFGKRKPMKVTPEELAKFPSGSFVGFKDGDLVKSKSGGPVYVISNGQRLPIASWAAAQAYGFDKIMSTVIKTDDRSINVHPLGPSLDVDTTAVTLASQ